MELFLDVSQPSSERQSHFDNPQLLFLPSRCRPQPRHRCHLLSFSSGFISPFLSNSLHKGTPAHAWNSVQSGAFVGIKVFSRQLRFQLIILDDLSSCPWITKCCNSSKYERKGGNNGSTSAFFLLDGHQRSVFQEIFPRILSFFFVCSSC